MDSIGAWHRLDAQLADEAGITLTDADRAALNASTLDEAAAYFHDHYAIGRDAQEVSDRFTSILFAYYRDEASEVAGALAFVRAARDAGVKMCVLSSSPQAFLQAG
ncbi:MAG: HAD family phosphatase, partial [Eggerthellaceae bacterium]|nr:HAD family phosphatase [Eggerthellaceae bacterium]